MLTVCFIVVLLTSFCHCDRVQRSGFGENCNDTVKCDKRALLSCKESVCDCVMLDDMVYDKIGKKCVAKAGERCKFGLIDSSRSNDPISLYEISGCVNNAQCSSDGTCVCNPTFYESFDGNCTAKGLVNETCTVNSECRDDKFLKCMDEKCVCDPKFAVYYGDVNSGKCVGKAGLELQEVDSCITGTQLTNKKCICQPATRKYAGSDGYCYTRKARNSPCVQNEECIYHYRYLSCINGTCDCDPGLYKWIDVPNLFRYNSELKWDNYSESGQCVGLAGKPTNEHNKCVEFAESRTNDRNVRICECSYGYYKTTKGSCGKSHGSDCSKDQECSDKYVCTNGNCGCPDSEHQIYNSNNKKCESVISGPCQNASDCVQNADCEFIEEYGYKQCHCNTGFVESPEGKCQLDYGSGCDYRKQQESAIEYKCDTVAGLKCRNGYCECPKALSYFNKDLRKCLSRVGSRCYENNSCVPNALCSSTGNPIPGNCECNTGYIVTKEKLCETPIPRGNLTTTTESINIMNEAEEDDFMNVLARIVIK